jgi:hypothetical protein
MKECAKVIVFFIMSKAVTKKNEKKMKNRVKKAKKAGIWEYFYPCSCFS